MAARRQVRLFGEDLGHELVGTALLERLAREEGQSVHVIAESARGGRGRAMAELVAWQRAVQRGTRTGTGDALVVLIDGNCEGVASTKRQIEQKITPGVWPEVVIGVPDPHVERWLIADPGAFHAVVDAPPPQDPGKCGRDVYKRLIRERMVSAGVPPLSSVLEFAPEIMGRLDLGVASRTQPALGALIDELRRLLRRLAARPDGQR